MTTRFVSSVELGEVVCEALGLNKDQVARIIIDLDCRSIGAVPVYVEMLADERLLHVAWGDATFGIVGAVDDG